MRKLCVYPDPVLRKKTSPIKKIDKEILTILDDMAQIMYKSKGIGLAAPQVGVSKQLIVIDFGEGILKLINPRIISKKGKHAIEEGCLSFPALAVKITRAKQIKVKALDEKFQEVVFDADDLFSTVLQHEIDHLNGKLIIDYVSWPKKWLLHKELKKRKCTL